MVASGPLARAGHSEPAAQARPHRPALITGAFFVFLLVWPVFWSNAKIEIPGDPGHWVNVPSGLRFVEPLVLLTAMAAAYLFGRPPRDRFRAGILRWLAALGVASIVGSLLAFPGVLNTLYGTYAVTVGFLLLVAVLAFRFDRTDLRTLTRYLVLLCALNWVVGVVQVLVLGVEADYVHGIFNDANTMSTVFYVVSGYCLYRYALSHSLPHLGYGLFLLPIAYLGFNEKLNLFFLGLVLPLVFLRLRKRVFSAVLAAVAGVLLVSATVNYATRHGLVGRAGGIADVIIERGGLLSLGVFRSWPTAWEQIDSGVPTLLFGSGASNFGGPVAKSRFNSGTATPSTNAVFALETRSQYLGAYDSPTNYFSNVLAEFGLVGFVATLVLLARIVLTLHQVGQRHANPDLAAWTWAAKWGWVMVAMQALFVPFGVFENLALMAPLALATGIVVGEARTVAPLVRAPANVAAAR